MADQDPPSTGDEREGVFARFDRSDMRLMRRAAREAWGVPDAVKNEAVYRIAEMLASPDTPKGKLLAAIRLAVTMDRVDQLAAAKAESETSVADAAAEFLKAVSDADRDDYQGPGWGGASQVPPPTGPVQPDDPGAR